MRRMSAAAGISALVLAGATYRIVGVEGGFLGHMMVHVVNLSIAAPLVGYALAPVWPGSASSPGFSPLNAPLAAAVAELVVVWVWHAPAPHEMARNFASAFVVEQASILVIGVLIWAPSFTALKSVKRSSQVGQSVVALFLTSMHMSLLGALLLFSRQPLYESGPEFMQNFCGQLPRDDQFAGATLMLAALGVLYLVAALAFLAHMLNQGASDAEAALTRQTRCPDVNRENCLTYPPHHLT